MSLGVTPSQTVGPFFGFALAWADGPEVVPEGTPGAITIYGRVIDSAGDGVPDAMIETWQADPDGRFNHPDDPRGAVDSGFRAFGRVATDVQGNWWIRTLKPGPVPSADGSVQAPHIDVSLLARGLLQRLVTRIYFPEDEDLQSGDPVLDALPPDAARGTLIAAKVADGYSHDIVMQGPGETIFFSV